MLPLLPKMPPKVMVINSASGTANYKPIAPAPISSSSNVMSVTNNQSMNAISSVVTNINNSNTLHLNQQHHSPQNHHKSKLSVDSNNITNSSVMSTSPTPLRATVPTVLFSHTSVNVSRKTSPFMGKYLFMFSLYIDYLNSVFFLNLKS